MVVVEDFIHSYGDGELGGRVESVRLGVESFSFVRA